MKDVFPIAQSDFSVLLRLGGNHQRVDVIGKLVSLKELPLQRHSKAEMWLKDESGKEFLINVWGPSMVAKLCHGDVQVGDIIQVDNCILQNDNTGGVSANAEAGQDSSHRFCAWLHTKGLVGARVQKLQALTSDRGDAISNAWAGSLSGGSSLRAETGKDKAIVTCCSTADACSQVAQESANMVEIQLHGVWLTAVRGGDIGYYACANCRTKVDQETGLCKKAGSNGCKTEQEFTKTILATVTLADATGVLENLLVNGDALCELTAISDQAVLVKQVEDRGTGSLCPDGCAAGSRRYARVYAAVPGRQRGQCSNGSNGGRVPVRGGAREDGAHTRVR